MSSGQRGQAISGIAEDVSAFAAQQKLHKLSGFRLVRGCGHDAQSLIDGIMQGFVYLNYFPSIFSNQ